MKIAPALSIHVAREAFVFRSAHESLTLPTVLYWEPTAAGPRCLAIGEAPQVAETGTRVDLFGSMPPGMERQWALEQFLMYALQRIMPPVILRPSVTVTGLGALDPLTNSQQAELLTRSLIAAGAAQVVFPEIERAT